MNKSEDYSKFDMLDDQKYGRFVKVMSTLQKEGIQIERSKYNISSLMKEVGVNIDQGKEASIGSSLGGSQPGDL